MTVLPRCLLAAFCAVELKTSLCGERSTSWVHTTPTACGVTQRVKLTPDPKINNKNRCQHQGIERLLLGQRFSWRVCQAVPVSRVCEQVGQDGAEQGEGDLLRVQTENAVEQLHHPIGPLLSSFLQQLLKLHVVHPLGFCFECSLLVLV